MPSDNSRRVSQTRTARTTRTQPRHRRRCQATPSQAWGGHQDAPPPPLDTRGPRRSREAETRARRRRSSEAETRPRSAQETTRPGREHPGRTKQEEPQPPEWNVQGQEAAGRPGLEHPGRNTQEEPPSPGLERPGESGGQKGSRQEAEAEELLRCRQDPMHLKGQCTGDAQKQR